MRRLRGLTVLLTAVLPAAVLAACTSSGTKQTGSAPATATQGSASSPAVSSSPASSSSSASSTRATGGSRDWPMYHGTPDRSGVSTVMPRVSGAPKVLARFRLDGSVYASPIVARGLTIVATENNTVYAFNSAYHQVWKRNLGRPSPASERPCGNIDPLGITGTPIYDSSTGLVYVSTELGGPPRHRLVALRLFDGAVQWQRGVDLPGVDKKAMQERGALAIAGGRVWVPFGGLAGDCGQYKGRVIGLRLDGSGAPVSYTVPTTREAGIWAPPGPVVDGTGHLLVAVGNGEAGQGDSYDHSDSVLKLDTNGRLLDSFSPATWAHDNDNDLDLGSQGPALVGKWVFIAGKSSTVYVLRADRLGGIGGQVSSAKICAGFGGTAVVGNVVFVPCTDGVRAVRVDDAGKLHVLWHTDENTAGSPVIGGGRVWAADQAGGDLHELDPKTGKSVGQATVGETSRFATPAISGRDVIVPTLTGVTVVRTS